MKNPQSQGSKPPMSAHICRVSHVYAARSVSSVVASPFTAGSAAHTARSSCNRARGHTAVFPVHILFTHLKVCLWGHTQTPAHTHAPFLSCFPAHLAVLSQKPHTRQCEFVNSQVREHPIPDTTPRGPRDSALQTLTGRDTILWDTSEGVLSLPLA